MPDPAESAAVFPPTLRTASLARNPGHPVEIQTRIELVRLAFRQLQGWTWISAIGVLALVFLVQNQAALSPLLTWVGFMALPIGSAWWLSHRFHRRRPEPTANRQWGLLLVIIATLGAAGWGATPWVFPSLIVAGVPRSAHMLLLAGLATASMRMLLPMRKGSVAYIATMMGPVALCYLTRGEAPLLVLTFFVGLFVSHTLWTTQHNHQILSDAIASRFEREELAAELRAENARRETRELDLRDARERAEAASQAKGDFLATISHEIRTPMNGVLGMLRIVRDTELTPAQRDYLKTATDSAEALLMLLNDVLDFSKIENHQLSLDHAAFSAAAAARVVADLHHGRARDKGLQFELRLANDLPVAVLGDAARVRQILINLVGNAIKFTERGRVELKVDCLERSPQRATLQFAVSDTGIGIDSVTLEKLFTPFTQADNSLGRRYGGTGLGLAISRRLTQAMGGSLQVQSVAGQGATFRLILPCQLPEVAPAPPPVEKPPRFVPPKLAGHVLVVEDDAVNQQVIELFLKKLNLSLQFAGDGETAVATATTEAFDLVLMDCHLPGIDGMEATRRIRKILDGRPLKIVALTANVSTNVHEACLASGMNDFLSKPVRFEQLANMLQRNLPAA